MLSVFLYLSYFLVFALFMVFVQLRMDTFSSFLAYALIIFPSAIPFVCIIIEQRKEEQKKAEMNENSNGN